MKFPVSPFAKRGQGDVPLEEPMALPVYYTTGPRVNVERLG